MDWKEIDTAPKDGTLVWLWGEGRMFLGQWRLRRWLWSGYVASREYSDSDTLALGGGPAHDVIPTHWMPLPEPPHE